jgi:hypothetical protein
MAVLLGVRRCNYLVCGGLWRQSNTATGVEKWRSDFLAGGVLSGAMNQIGVAGLFFIFVFDTDWGVSTVCLGVGVLVCVWGGAGGWAGG